MHRFYLAPEQTRGDLITLAGSEAHHAMRVLRVRTGERVVVLDGAGQTLGCEVADMASKSVLLKVLERKINSPPLCAITLLQAVPKGKIIESIIQKAVELGAVRIVPILAERVVMQLDSDSAETKAGKWQHGAIEAIKQCGGAWLPKVEVPVSLESYLAREEKFELPLVGCLEAGSPHPRSWFDRFFNEHGRAPASIAVWVGPEGDFTADEYSAIKESGALPITLGPLVLRVETATIYCLSVLTYELQARGPGPVE
ncbi:MAG TPA: RsmE family RNA methyltransferase [Methylomirabilota bacterium]|nr:RsmE family RNA methyltransferase [Methylomirabilota bacterium]